MVAAIRNPLRPSRTAWGSSDARDPVPQCSLQAPGSVQQKEEIFSSSDTKFPQLTCSGCARSSRWLHKGQGFGPKASGRKFI